MYQLRLVNYFDVWGNRKEGYEVNNLCVEWDDGYVADLENRSLLQLLKNSRFIKKETRINQIRFDWIGPDVVEFSAVRDDMPLGRLEIINPEEHLIKRFADIHNSPSQESLTD